MKFLWWALVVLGSANLALFIVCTAHFGWGRPWNYVSLFVSLVNLVQAWLYAREFRRC